MLTYRRIETEEQWPEVIWTAEGRLSSWFRSASYAWTSSLEEFKSFWSKVSEVHGLFDDQEPDTLLACVYLEHIGEDSLNIHVSVIGKVERSELVRFFAALKSQKAAEGFRSMCGYVTERNPLIRVAAQAGFTATGLRMRYGSFAGGKSIGWAELRG